MKKQVSLSKRLLAIVGKGLLAGFIAGLVLTFMALPVGLLLYMIGIKWINEIVTGGIHSLRTFVIISQLVSFIVATGYFAYKDFKK
ncbi:MAG: hypothetical protein L3V56_13690 [Candidatus Magnetoovum sp. WYHC-5]|nr:hypothetical protein [Candidatus Magnetoovum sp. WYHC-5]